MTKTVQFRRHGEYMGAYSHTDAIRALAQQIGKLHVRDSALTALTDSSGGTASTTRTVGLVTTAFVNVANSGGNLALNSTNEANITVATMQAALGELWARSNAVAALVGAAVVTNNGGGTAPNGTIDALDVSATAGTTGAQAAALETLRAEYNLSLVKLTKQVQDICEAVGEDPPLIVTSDAVTSYTATIAAHSTTLGAGADPGVAAAAVDAAMVIWTNSVATVAARLNAVTNAAVLRTRATT